MNVKKKHAGSNVVPTRWNQIFAKNFTKRLREKGLAQNKLAEAMGVNESTVRNWKKGDIPKGDYLILLSNHLKCSIDWLVKNEGLEPKPPGQKTGQAESTTIYKVESHTDHVAAPERQYDPHGGWEPRPEMLDDDHRMLGFAFQILMSKSIYRNALIANITAFYNALLADRELKKTQKDLKDTKGILKNHIDEITSLKKTCGDLYDRVVALEKKKDGDEKLKNF